MFLIKQNQHKDKSQHLTSATRQVRQRWFSVGIFPLGQFLGLTGNRPQSAPACSFLALGVILNGCMNRKFD